MTINSVLTDSDRGASITTANPAGTAVIIEVSRSGDPINVRVSPEDFAREITEANIPGLTVTYEKPSPPLPTEPGWYAARDDIDSGRSMYGLIGLGNDGNWQSPESAKYWHQDRGGLVRMIPESRVDL